MVSRKTIPEQELIELLASRDVKGLEYLYDRYSAALYGVIHRIVGVQERSEEILQETFLRIWSGSVIMILPRAVCSPGC